MKLLITGGCGFLGSNLASHALKSGYDLVVMDNLSRLGSDENLKWLREQNKPFSFINADIKNSVDVDRVVKEFMPNTVFHLAGQVAMTTSIANPRHDFETNTLGTFNILEALRQYCPNAAIIYSSTNKVYGDLEQYTYSETNTRYVCNEMPNGFNEDTSLSFHSPYGVSKGSADQYMLDYHRIFGLRTVVFRHSSMYGGRQFSTFDQGWVGWFCQKALECKADANVQPFTIAGNGKQVRDVLHADDMIDIYFNAVHKTEKIAGNAFNIGGGVDNSLSLLELFDFLEKKLSIKLNYIKTPQRISDQKIFIADISKANTIINWQPKTTFKEGVSKMLEWLSAQSKS